MPEDRALWPAYLSGGKLNPTTTINATLITEDPSLSMSSSLPNASQLRKPSYSSARIHECAINSTIDVKHVRTGLFSIGRSDLDDTISRATSSPIDLRPVKNISGISARSKSEGEERTWNSHSPSIVSISSYSPPTEDDSDFEMNEQSTINRAFNHLEGGREETREKTSEWDGLEMEMEM